jgi:hypothetical protein
MKQVKGTFFIIQQTQLTELVYLFYLSLVNVSAVQISHHQAGQKYKVREASSYKQQV